jgi:hypothetical protein
MSNMEMDVPAVDEGTPCRFGRSGEMILDANGGDEQRSMIS